jgi:tRNA dimethylallyltransferase
MSGKRAASSAYDVLFISTSYKIEQLYVKINKRVLIMLEEGLLDEVKELLKKGYLFDTPSFSAIAYPLAQKYLKKELTKEDFIAKWQQKERNYARRQITWFKRYTETVYVRDTKDANDVIEKWLNGS